MLNESKEANFKRPDLFLMPCNPRWILNAQNALLKMERDGVIERVSPASSAAPIVVVGKKDSDDVRVCGDFSVTYNDQVHVLKPILCLRLRICILLLEDALHLVSLI